MLTRKQALLKGIDPQEAARIDAELIGRGILQEGQSAFIQHKQFAGKMNYGPDSKKPLGKLQEAIGLKGDNIDGDFGPVSERHLQKSKQQGIMRLPDEGATPARAGLTPVRNGRILALPDEAPTVADTNQPVRLTLSADAGATKATPATKILALPEEQPASASRSKILSLDS